MSGPKEQEGMGWPREAHQESAQGEPLVSLPFDKTQSCIQPKVLLVRPVHL